MHFQNWHARGSARKRATGGVAHLLGSMPGLQSSVELSQRWWHCVRFDRPGNQTHHLLHR